jgi:hypothetical protein
MRSLVLACLIAVTGCHPKPPPWYGSDGPQVEPTGSSSGEPASFGSHCPAGCAMATMVLGFVSLPYTITSIAIGPRRLLPNVRKPWAWVGVGLGTTLLAIGTTHAILNRHELASDAIVPLSIGVPTGGAALAVGIWGLAGGGEHDATATSAIACHGKRCRPGIPTPMITIDGASLSLASGRF